MVRVTEAYLEARRLQVLDAARACFARQGFHRTTMHDIAQEAGLSTGVAYRYFSSKEEIIAAIGRETRGRVLPPLAGAAQQGDTRAALAGLAALLQGLVEDPAAFDDHRVSLEVWAEALHNPDILACCKDSEDAVLGFLTGFARAAQTRGDYAAGLDPQAVARVMLALVDGLVLQKAMQPDLSVTAYVQAAAAMLGGTLWTGGGERRTSG